MRLINLNGTRDRRFRPCRHGRRSRIQTWLSRCRWRNGDGARFSSAGPGGFLDDWHDGKVFRLKGMSHHDRDLKEDPTFMCSGVTAFTVTKTASTTTSSNIDHALNMITKMVGKRNQVRMAFREVLSNRSSSNPHVTKSAVIGNLIDQC